MAEEEISTQALDADQRITPIDELTPASAVTDTDLLVIEHADGGTESATVAQLKNGLETASHASNTYLKIADRNRYIYVNNKSCNEVVENGFYYSESWSDDPNTIDGQGILIVYGWNGNSWLQQEFYSPYENKRFIRTCTSGTWSSWQELATNSYKYVTIWEGNIGNGETLQINNFTDNANKYRNYIFEFYRSDLNIKFTANLSTTFFFIADTNVNINIPRTNGYVAFIPRYIQTGSEITISNSEYKLVKVYGELN